MTKNYAQKLDDYVNRANAYRASLPGVGEASVAHTAEVYKGGALSGKNKRLMALVGALVGGCEGCILFQSTQAMELGATVEEVLEAAAVAASLGGTMAESKITWLVGCLQERGVME